jgi:tetratricopeptide (TPR) repeat protein
MIQKSADNKAKENQAKMDKEEQEKKVEMFLKVLEIDSVDEVANFGLGSIYLKLDRYEDALKHLQIVVENNKDYSAAYLLLGKTWENLSNKENAAEVYRDGIAAASRKGDLMPLRDMQNRLNQISQSGA